jgi:hypothetical protein
MPDHVHLLVEGITESADLRRFAANAKQRPGGAYALRYGGPLWQEGFYDRVLRRSEDAKSVARYLLRIPFDRAWVTCPRDYPSVGSDVWSIDDLLASVI